MNDETRGPGPMTEGEMIESMKHTIGVNTLVEVVQWVNEKALDEALKPIVSVDQDGKLRIAPLTVRQTMQLMAALEGLQVVAQ